MISLSKNYLFFLLFNIKTCPRRLYVQLRCTHCRHIETQSQRVHINSLINSVENATWLGSRLTYLQVCALGQVCDDTVNTQIIDPCLTLPSLTVCFLGGSFLGSGISKRICYKPSLASSSCYVAILQIKSKKQKEQQQQKVNVIIINLSGILFFILSIFPLLPRFKLAFSIPSI